MVRISVNKHRIAGNRAALTAKREDKVVPVIRVRRATGTIHVDEVAILYDGKIIARFLTDYTSPCATVECVVEDEAEVIVG